VSQRTGSSSQFNGKKDKTNTTKKDGENEIKKNLRLTKVDLPLQPRRRAEVGGHAHVGDCGRDLAVFVGRAELRWLERFEFFLKRSWLCKGRLWRPKCWRGHYQRLSGGCGVRGWWRWLRGRFRDGCGLDNHFLRFS